MHRSKWLRLLDRVRLHLPHRTKTSDGATWWNYRGHQYRYRRADNG